MQDLSLQLLQLRRRIEPLLVREGEPHRVVDPERLRLPTAAIERKHQLAAQPVVRVGGRRRALPAPRRVRRGEPSRELGVETLLEGDDAQLVEACGFVPGELLLVEVCERLAIARERAPRRAAQRVVPWSASRASPSRRSKRFASTSSGSIASR